jgi:hypothetical protein
MTRDLVIIFLGIIFAIGFILVIAHFLQKQLVERRFSSNIKEPPQESPSLEQLELSEKLRQNSGIDFPTFEIKTLLSIPNSDDAIVMLNHKQAFQNVLRCNSSGSIVWMAELPEKSGDVYTNLDWHEKKLIAFSWSCFIVLLDIETGKILSSVFTK